MCRDGTIPCITLILGGNLTQGKTSMCFLFLKSKIQSYHHHPCVLLHKKWALTVSGLGMTITGLRSSKIKPLVIIGVICIRYIVLPIIGIWIVKVANHLGFLPPDPLFSYVLMVQFTLPPAMNIGEHLDLNSNFGNSFLWEVKNKTPINALLQQMQAPWLSCLMWLRKNAQSFFCGHTW